jgi:hypothetical protein
MLTTAICCQTRSISCRENQGVIYAKLSGTGTAGRGPFGVDAAIMSLGLPESGIHAVWTGRRARITGNGSMPGALG